MAPALPRCGIYRTTGAIGDIPAGRLVYFHDHGNPGPGVYLPESWSHNRARFAENGFTLPQPYDLHARQLEALPHEGLYRVLRPFHCCEKKCREFEPELLVQVGYNGAAEAIVFTPEFGPAGMTIPTSGMPVNRAQLANLAPLKVVESAEKATARGPSTASGMLH